MAQTYSFLDVHVAINGPGGAFSIRDGAAKEGVTTDMVEDKNTMTIGAAGDAMHSLKATKAGHITLRLLKTSPVNFLLAALYNFQSSSAATWGQNTIVLSDIARGDVYTCQQAAFKKFPNNSYAEEGGTIEWEFDVAVMDPLLGIGTPAI